MMTAACLAAACLAAACLAAACLAAVYLAVCLHRVISSRLDYRRPLQPSLETPRWSLRRVPVALAPVPVATHTVVASGTLHAFERPGIQSKMVTNSIKVISAQQTRYLPSVQTIHIVQPFPLQRLLQRLLFA